MTETSLSRLSIQVRDPLAAHLGGPAEVETFSISILDAARLSGHLCPSVAGAFLITRAAVHALFPDTKVCERGLLLIDIPGSPTEAALGPMGQVMSYITGSWGETGFGGLKGEFIRRNLLRYHSKKIAPGHFRFERKDTGKSVEISYHPNRAKLPETEGLDFKEAWQARVMAILGAPDVIEVREVETN